jgi:CHASE2 domain-containing sensor protein
MFQLLVKQEKDICTFELSWGGGQRLSRDLPFSRELRSLYQEWQHAYLSYYQTVRVPLTVTPESGELRGKAAGGGPLNTPVDWHARLVESETRLLYEFHRWLRQGELFDLYEAIAGFSRNLPPDTPFIDIFLTCQPLELARLPWEAWELGAAFATNRRIRIARTPLNIRKETAKATQKQRRRPRILVILGSDLNQNFEGDWQQLRRSLKGIAELPDHPIGWRPEPGQDVSQGIPREQIDRLKDQIKTALVDPRGWDVLFFAGHSNENQIMGGELGIAPGVSIRVSEIAPQLEKAKENGLQFALFNSCSGLSVAESFIDLGLSQVAVMREPVHNRVAQEFLVQFIQALAKYEDVHEALLAACQYLKTEKNLTHPSAHLIPSLFRHPEATLFRIQPQNWFSWVKPWIPRSHEAVALIVLGFFSLWTPMQLGLLDQRLKMQAIYRQTIHPTEVQTPPVLLVQIDKQSLIHANIGDLQNVPHAYLAQVIQKLTERKARLIGVDYVLSTSRDDTQKLAQTIQQSGANGIRFVFAVVQDKKNNFAWEWTLPEIADFRYSVHADAVRSCEDDFRVPLPGSDASQLQPFSYILVQLYRNITQSPSATTSKTNQQTAPVMRGVVDPSKINLMSPCLPLNPVTQFSRFFGQLWLNPIIDYSIPPDQIYQRTSAKTLLESSAVSSLPKDLTNWVVIVAPAGEATAFDSEQEIFTPPAAMAHWYAEEGHRMNQGYVDRKTTAAELHAYLLHHFLNQRLVVPIPDLWMVLLAAALGKSVVLIMERFPLQGATSRSPMRLQRWQGFLLLVVGTTGYAILSLEVYTSSVAILLPILLPVATFWIFVTPTLLKKSP